MDLRRVCAVWSAGVFLCTLFVSAAPDSVYVFGGGKVIVVEPERLNYNKSYWQLNKSPSGYTGGGWLKNIKGGTGGGGMCHNMARDISCLTAEEGWIKIPVYIDDPSGYFGVQIRAYRPRDGDGGNDVWVTVENYAELMGSPLYAFRLGSSSKGYHWSWGAVQESGECSAVCARFSLSKAGPNKVHNFVISGRSAGFGVDRFVIFRFDQVGGPYPQEAWKTSTPVSRKVALDDVQATVSVAPVGPTTGPGWSAASSASAQVFSLGGRLIGDRGVPALDRASGGLRIVRTSRGCSPRFVRPRD